MAAAASAAGWQYFLDESTGYHYWWHPESGESQWDATEEASEADAAAGTPQALWGTGAGGSGASDEEDVSGSSDSDEEQVERPRARSGHDTHDSAVVRNVAGGLVYVPFGHATAEPPEQ